MQILVRNEEHVSECVLLNGGYLPREEILSHPVVQQFVAGRQVRHFSMSQRPTNEVLVVDLDLSK